MVFNPTKWSQRPLILDRLELRICDFVHDINLLLGITAMIELRILNLFENINTLDPLNAVFFLLMNYQKYVIKMKLMLLKIV